MRGLVVLSTLHVSQGDIDYTVVKCFKTCVWRIGRRRGARGPVKEQHRERVDNARCRGGQARAIIDLSQGETNACFYIGG